MFSFTERAAPAIGIRGHHSDEPLAENDFGKLFSQGSSLMRAGRDVAARATDKFSNDATHPDLKEALKQAKPAQQRGIQILKAVMR